MQKWKLKLDLIAVTFSLILPGSFLLGQGFDRGNLIFYGMGVGGFGNN